MIKVIGSEERRPANRGWLDTRWHFSFHEYFDPANVNWGPLRVFNDDRVQPGKGFGSHGHRDMEIVTCGLEGELEHRDREGRRVLGRSSIPVTRLSATLEEQRGERMMSSQRPMARSGL